MTKALSKEDLARLSTGELLQLFSQLEAPTLEEMQGEYKAGLLAPSHFESACGDVKMVDEVRRVAPYRGDIGQARKNFVISTRELPATSGA